MQHTTKYKFNLIETSDTFSPDALNANAEVVEKELAALAEATAKADTALQATHAADKAALEAADKALSQADAANKSALEQSIASARSALEKADTDNKTALEKALADQKAALQTAIGSGGDNCRFICGSYVGTGTSTVNGACRLTFDFEPWLVCVGGSTTSFGLLIRPGTQSNVGATIWDRQSVSWYNSGSSASSASLQLNTRDQIYYYIALGKSL